MSFSRIDYHAVYYFARSQYYWHESTGRGFDLQAAIIMQRCEDVIGQMSDFPSEARERLAETPNRVKERIWRELAEGVA